MFLIKIQLFFFIYTLVTTCFSKIGKKYKKNANKFFEFICTLSRIVLFEF